MGVLATLGIVLIVLKLIGVIAFGWFYVLLPFFIVPLVFAVFFVGGGVIAAFFAGVVIAIDKFIWRHKK